jgi:hypothetical protein
MSLFGKIVKTVVNVAALPIELAKDIGTLGGVATKGEFRPYTQERIEKLVEDADDE